ncbi:MAG: inorganic phosphate transporter, partial [Lacunisphaera sp.]
MTIFLTVLLAALAFEYINGFHDAANAIATVVSTKVLTPRQAIALAAVFNLIGALAGTAVAKTISGGLVDAHAVTMNTILSALLAAIVWNLLTWWLGLPSSSSHALIGGLCGAALATSSGDWSVLIWSSVDATGHSVGLWPKVVMPMFASPVAGFVGGALLMFLLLVFVHRLTPRTVNGVFGKLQLVSAALMGYS